MRKLAVLPAGAALLIGLIAGSAVHAGVLDFEDLPVGQTYAVNQGFVTSGVGVAVGALLDANGNPQYQGAVAVESGGQAGGSGNELFTRSANAEFGFGSVVSSVAFRFGYRGGNVNLRVNGELLFSTTGPLAWDGHYFSSGVHVSVMGGYTQGTIELTGAIQQVVTVGGQEFWIDDVRYEPAEPPTSELFFSTEEDFETRNPGVLPPGDLNTIISDGDLLNSSGYLYMRNQDLLRVWNPEPDLGLDAVYVVDPRSGLVAFSTELDHPVGFFTAGDLLATNGAVIPNAVLLAAFDLPESWDLGLDAVHFEGETEEIVALLEKIAQFGPQSLPENHGELLDILQGSRVDIWFSVEGTGPYDVTAERTEPPFLDGDLLRARDGFIVRNAELLPFSVPAGLRDRGVDLGLDAITACLRLDVTEDVERSKQGPTERWLLSTELLFEGERGFNDGDVLQSGDWVYVPHGDLLAAFEPKSFVGLDALSRVPFHQPPVECGRFTKIGGVYVDPMTLHPITGYANPIPSGPLDRPFGAWIGIRGQLGPAADGGQYRILWRKVSTAAQGSVPIPSGWQVPPWSPPGPYPFPAVGLLTDGWVDVDAWNQLSDVMLGCWNSASIGAGDGQYILSLVVKRVDGTEVVCDKVAVQIDNTTPCAVLDTAYQCRKLDCCEPIPLNAVFFDEHFSHYDLCLGAYWMPWMTIINGSYNPPPVPPPYLNDKGTANATCDPAKPSCCHSPPDPLCSAAPPWESFGSLNICDFLGPSVREGRYTIRLRVWDRALLGSFYPSGNLYLAMHWRHRRDCKIDFECTP